MYSEQVNIDVLTATVGFKVAQVGWQKRHGNAGFNLQYAAAIEQGSDLGS
jgi:hypothetical protein